jgi:hypothetical protein
MTKALSACIILAVATTATAGEQERYLIGEPNCRVVNTSPLPNESIRWSGACKDGFADGSGKLEWFVGETLSSHYEGGMRRGRPHGHGDYFFSSKARYEGEFDNGLMHGAGVSTSPTGDAMTTVWAHGEPGEDVDIAYKNGNHYIGKFRNGKREGQGTMARKDGSRYVGNFKLGFWDGYGVFTSEIGATYEGEWKQGRREGRGVQNGPAGSRYEGEWKADLYDGKGKMAYANGASYEGTWKEGKFDGKGTLVYANGQRFEGEFSNGSPLGLASEKPAETSK